MKVVGIDPDMNGAFALLDFPKGGPPTILHIQPMPLYTPPIKGDKGLDIPAAYAALQSYKTRYGASVCFLESALVMAQKGSKGQAFMMGSIGRVHATYGSLKALCEITFGRPNTVAAWPSAWKKDLGIGSDKEAARALACKLHPGHTKVLGRVKNTGYAEAVLLTHWGVEKMNLSSLSS